MNTVNRLQPSSPQAKPRSMSHQITQQSTSLLLLSVSFPLPWPHLFLRAPTTVHQERECFSNLLASVGCASSTNQCTSVYWTGDSCSRHKQDQALVSFRWAAGLKAVLPTAKVQPSPQARKGSRHLTLPNLDKCSLSCILMQIPDGDRKQNYPDRAILQRKLKNLFKILLCFPQTANSLIS